MKTKVEWENERLVKIKDNIVDIVEMGFIAPTCISKLLFLKADT